MVQYKQNYPLPRHITTNSDRYIVDIDVPKFRVPFFRVFQNYILHINIAIFLQNRYDILVYCTAPDTLHTKLNIQHIGHCTSQMILHIIFKKLSI